MTYRQEILESPADSMPKNEDSGIYNLIMELRKARRLRIGRLGTFCFPAGCYVYTGSAQSGLSKRIDRHRSKTKKLHWHIDYLLKFAKIVGVHRHAGSKELECLLNERIYQLAGAQFVVKGFGSSDCKCKAHLIFFPSLDRNLLSRIHEDLI